MTREYRKKKGSVKKRKRTGFHDVRPRGKASETRNDPTTSSGNHNISHVSNRIPMPILSPADESISSKELLKQFL